MMGKKTIHLYFLVNFASLFFFALLRVSTNIPTKSQHNCTLTSKMRPQLNTLQGRIIDALQQRFVLIPISDCEAAADIEKSSSMNFENLQGEALLKAVQVWLKHRADHGLALTEAQKVLATALSGTLRALKKEPFFTASRQSHLSESDSNSNSNTELESQSRDLDPDSDSDSDSDSDEGLDKDTIETHIKQQKVINNKDDYEVDECDDDISDSSEDEEDYDSNAEFDASSSEDRETASWLELWSTTQMTPKLKYGTNNNSAYIVSLSDETQSLSAQLDTGNGQLRVKGVVIPCKETRQLLIAKAHEWYSSLPYHKRYALRLEDLILRLGHGRFGNVNELISLPRDADVHQATAQHTNKSFRIIIPKKTLQTKLYSKPMHNRALCGGRRHYMDGRIFDENSHRHQTPFINFGRGEFDRTAFW